MISTNNSQDNEILNLKKELNKYKQLLEQKELKLNNLQSQINNLTNIINNNNKSIETFKNIIVQKDIELNKLKSNSNNNLGSININSNFSYNNNEHNKKLVDFNQIMCVNFISSDGLIHYSVPCMNNNTFAEVEEKLYLQFPKYRETNNQFLANGKTVLRFKTIGENKLGAGFPVTMIAP